MKCLDLFCGLGGWSLGFMKEDFEVLGVDIIDVGYPSFNILLKDVRALDGKEFQDYDVIVGSPPCRDFSLLSNFSMKWKRPRNVKDGLSMVYAFLRIIKEANPKYWVMENVPQLENYIKLKPITTILMKTPRMKRSLWGIFPSCLFPYQLGTPNQEVKGKYKQWKRAKIPLSISQTLAKAIKRELEK